MRPTVVVFASRGNVISRTRGDEFTEERSDPRRDSPLNHTSPYVEIVEALLKLFALFEHGVETQLKLLAIIFRVFRRGASRFAGGGCAASVSSLTLGGLFT